MEHPPSLAREDEGRYTLTHNFLTLYAKTDLSAQKTTQESGAWMEGAYADDDRAQSNSSATAKRAPPPFRIKMLARQHRLSSADALRHLFARGRRFHVPPLSLIAALNQKSVVRCAVIVPVAVAKKATQRNKLRRRVSERVRILLPTLSPGYDCAFLVRKPATTLERKKMGEMVDVLLRRAGLLKSYTP